MDGFFGDVLVLGDNVLEVVLGDEVVVVSLAEDGAVELSELHLGDLVVDVALEDNELSVLLLLEDLKGLGLEGTSNDTIANGAGEEGGEGDIDATTAGSEITEGAHGVGVTGLDVGDAGGRVLAVSLIGLDLNGGERCADSST